MNNMESLFIGLVANQYIEGMFETARQVIKAQGYHHWKLDKFQFNHAGPDSNIFKLQVLINKFLIAGADKLEARNVIYNSSTSSINFEAILPELTIKSGKSSVVITLFGKEFDSRIRGRVVLKNLRLLCKGEIGITQSRELKIKNADAKLTLESVTSQVTFTALGMDFSEAVNNFLSVTLPELIQLHGDTWKELLLKIFNEHQSQI